MDLLYASYVIGKMEKLRFVLKQTTIGSPVKKRKKHDCTQVDHNQLDPLFQLYSYTPLFWFVVHGHSVVFKTCTILVYMILNGKGLINGSDLHMV